MAVFLFLGKLPNPRKIKPLGGNPQCNYRLLRQL